MKITSKECLEKFKLLYENKCKSPNNIFGFDVCYITIKQDLDQLEILEKENKELKEENKILKEGIKSLLNYCDDLYLYEEKPYHITEEGIIHTFFDYEKEDLEKIKLMFEVLEND